MTSIDEFNPTPRPDYDGLLFQFRALCRLYNSTRDQCSFMAKTICDLNKRIAGGALDAVDSERAANAQLTAEVEALRQERDELRARMAELERERLPNEQGKNRYGVDVAYFRKTINRELNRPLVNYKPDELARVLARLSVTADSAVVMEPEFQRAEALAKIKAEAVREARQCAVLSREHGDNDDYMNGFDDAIAQYDAHLVKYADYIEANQIEGGE